MFRVVFANRFNRLSRNSLGVGFLRKHIQILWVDRFFKTKKKNRKLEKIWKKAYVFEQIDKSILVEKS